MAVASRACVWLGFGLAAALAATAVHAHDIGGAYALGEVGKSSDSGGSTQQPAAAATTALPASIFTTPARQHLPPLAGWNVRPDPPAVPWKPTLSLRASIPAAGAAFPVPPGPFLATWSMAGGFVTWTRLNVDTGRFDATLRGKDMPLNQVILSPDGRYLASVITKSTVHKRPPVHIQTVQHVSVWSFAHHARVASWKIPDNRNATIIGFARHDDLLWQQNGATPQIVRASVKTQKIAGRWNGAFGPNQPAISPGGRYLAIFDGVGVRIRSTQTGKLLANVTFRRQSVFGSATGRAATESGLAISPSGNWLIADISTSTGPFRVRQTLDAWSMRTGRLVACAPLHLAQRLVNNYFQSQKYALHSLGYLPAVDAFQYNRRLIDARTGRTFFVFPNPVPQAMRRMGQAGWEMPAGVQHLVYVSNPTGERFGALVLAADTKRLLAQLASVRAGNSRHDATLPPLTRPNRASVRLVTFMANPNEPWRYRPTTTPMASTVTWREARLRPLPVRRAIGSTLETDVESVHLAGRRLPQALVQYRSHRLTFAKDQTLHTVVDRIDTQGGSVLGKFRPPTTYFRVLDFSRGGNTMLAAIRHRVELYHWPPGKQPVPVVGWKPGNMLGGAPLPIQAAKMLDSTHVLTIMGGGAQKQLCVWKLPQCRALWWAPFSQHCTLSASRKTLALPWRNAILLVHATTGKLLGVLHDSARSVLPSASRLYFSPGGRRIAAVNGAYAAMAIWNLANGKLTTSLTLPNESKMGDSEVTGWSAPGYFCLNGALIDLAHGAEVGRLSASPSLVRISGCPDGRIWLLVRVPTPMDPSLLDYSLVGAALPQPRMQDSLSAARHLHPLRLRGKPVRLNVQIGMTPKLQQQFNQWLARRLEQRRMTAQPAAPSKPALRLSVRTQLHASRTQQYGHGFMGNIQPQQTVINTYQLRFQLRAGKTSVWHVDRLYGDSTPAVVTLAPGQSTQQIISAMNQQSFADCFQSLPMPCSIARRAKPFFNGKITAYDVIKTAPRPGGVMPAP